jgi:hypothetical protein
MILTPFLLWFATFLLFAWGVHELRPMALGLRNYFLQAKEVEALRRAVNHLKLLSEMLESGIVPEAHDWRHISSFPTPWNQLVLKSVTELRAQGAPVLPTLSRMQKTLEEQAELILEGKVKSSQAFGQGFLGMILVPAFAVVLYVLMPGLQNATSEFLMIVIFSFFLSTVSLIWMTSLVDQARFGNMKSENRRWIVSVNVALERMMALVSTGLPADLAYKKTIEELATQDATLAREWKPQIWDSGHVESSLRNSSEAERLILGLGHEVRKTIQTSLLEGRGCLDRLESIHRTFLLDLRMRIGRELSLLPNRCLKPLFICVFPAVMILLFGSMGLCFQSLF